MGSSENQSFLDEGAISGQQGLGVLGGQMTRLHDGTIFGGGCDTLKGVPGAVKKKSIFQHICDTLKGTWDSPIWPRISP